MVLRVVAPFLLGAALFSCGGGKEEIRQKEKEAELGPMTVNEAKSVYITNCTSCHGMDGKKGLSGAADLSKSTKSDAEILETIRNGNDKGMMPYKDMLTDREQKGVVEFVKTLKQ